jgi:hypothetical protein
VETTKLWIVGQVYDINTTSWVFQGVFDSEEKAIAACRDKTYFVGPATLNESLPHEDFSWVEAYYPLNSDSQAAPRHWRK